MPRKEASRPMAARASRALGMDGIKGQSGGAQHMQPLQGPGDAQPVSSAWATALATSPDRSPPPAWSSAPRPPAPWRRAWRARARFRPTPGAGRRSAGRAVAILGEIHRQRRDPCSVLHGRIDSVGEGTAVPLAAGAHARHGAILGDLAANHQIGDLATFGQLLNGDVRQATPAGAATGERNHDGVLGILHQAAGGTRVAFLPAGLLATGLTQRARRGLLERRIRGRGLARVVAILGQARFQLPHPFEQLFDLRPQPRVLRAQTRYLGVQALNSEVVGASSDMAQTYALATVCKGYESTKSERRRSSATSRVGSTLVQATTIAFTGTALSCRPA